MAKGNDGNYLQHCVEVEAALRLVREHPSGQLHIAVTHGMKPFERFDVSLETRRPGLTRGLLKKALRESGEPPRKGREERSIVSAYRKTKASENRYPNSGELLCALIGAHRISGGIAEVCASKYEALRERWHDSRIVPVHSSWRAQIGTCGRLACPNDLHAPWLFTMDPMSFSESGDADDASLRRVDLDRLSAALTRYVESRQPGVAALFVYGVKPWARLQFWRFVDDLAENTGMSTCSYWLKHQGGNRNLAALLYANVELSSFAPPEVNVGRE